MRAIEQLIGTTLPVKVIAAELGYRVPFDFTRAFRKEYGLTPTKFRNIWHPHPPHRAVDASSQVQDLLEQDSLNLTARPYCLLTPPKLESVRQLSGAKLECGAATQVLTSHPAEHCYAIQMAPLAPG
jgi:Helix-turn-helix domain